MNPSPLSLLVRERFREALPAGLDFCSLRLSEEHSENLSVRRNIAQPVGESLDVGAMVTVISQGGLGYSATTDLSLSGIRAAIERARRWAERSAYAAIFDFRKVAMPAPVGTYHSRVDRPWSGSALPDRLGLLREVSESLPIDPRIVEWEASLMNLEVASTYLTSHGGEVFQTFSFMAPDISVVAADGPEVQRRTFGGLRSNCQQGGLEVLDRVGFAHAGPTLAREALELLSAPNCPSGRMDLLLDPDQMMLQIHESIGHPLELDRILGDERNYAGTSFVTMDMFGTYQYGSRLLNVTFDPTIAEQFASYGFDDEGRPAERAYIIREGMLERPLGATTSQARSGMPGVANARASSWNRPPIDRMANLNVEPGDSSFDALVAKVERGIYMRSNTSWSIDDSRNKFQFGCEYARLIENGELKGVVKNPNYRGISANFWRSLSGVGDRSTFAVLGTPFCGKGEPNQVVRVGHASPACLFSDVDVFGGV
jgi:predicted Zn-dependent protease